jgi:Domain of unknown function (DUF222)
VIEGFLVDWSMEQPAGVPRLPVGLLDDAQRAAELARVQQRRAMDAAYEAELVLDLAAGRPDTLDPSPGSPGARSGSWAPDGELPGVSEFFTAELSVVLNCGRGTAAHLARRAWTWREKLPATFAALAAGTIDERRARELADVLQHTSAEVARAVEDRLLGEAPSLSLRRLRNRATELVIELDAAAVDRRREQAQRAADVRTWPAATEGMATLAAALPVEEAAACYDLVDQLARMLKADGDKRPIGQLRAAVLSLLIRRPADHGLPEGAQIQLTVTASLSALDGTSTVPGEVNGHPITAAHLRELLARAGALGLTTPQGGSLLFAVTDADGGLLATLTAAELARLARRGCTTHPDAACACPVTEPPPRTQAYEPTDAQRRWVRTRDRTCRFPNCGRRVAWTDLDHVVAHACGGETDCTNLCCLCRSHHRLKTFARGWQFVMDADGTLHVTTPSGVTRTTRPPGLRPRATAPPPVREDAAPQDDDPPPF